MLQMVQMSPEELAFWRSLLAPFPGIALSVKRIGGTELTYIDKRSLANRLDTVVGPGGWYAKYRDEGGRGLIFALSIRIPTADGPTWVTKEDGGSDEGMTKKVGGQQVEDVDNNFKSETTNSFRRAAQDAWGIGRYLYQRGIPDWLDPNCPAEAVCGPAPASSAPPAVQVPVVVPEPSRANVLAPTPVERIDIPTAGPNVFPWAKAMESKFKTNLVNGMKEGADPPQVSTRTRSTPGPRRPSTRSAERRSITSRRCGTTRASSITSRRPTRSSRPPKSPCRHRRPSCRRTRAIRWLRCAMELVTKLGFLFEKQTGQKATNEQLLAVFQAAAAECMNAAGHVGEVPESLKSVTDSVWLKNVLALVDENINKVSVVASEVASECPF